MHIDAHQHFWRYNTDEFGWIDDSMRAIQRDFLPDDLTPELARNDVQRSITVQTRQTLEETRWLLELADHSPSILGVVGWVDFCSPNVRSQLKQFVKNPKFVGVRHIVRRVLSDGHVITRCDGASRRARDRGRSLLGVRSS